MSEVKLLSNEYVLDNSDALVFQNEATGHEHNGTAFSVGIRRDFDDNDGTGKIHHCPVIT